MQRIVCAGLTVRPGVALFVLFLLCAHPCQSCALAGETDPVVQRFRDEGPVKWADYLSYAKTLQGSITSSLDVLDPKDGRKPYFRIVYDVKQNPDCASLQTKELLQDGSESRAEEVLASNPRYSFLLTRTASKPDWLLKDLDVSGSEVPRFSRSQKSIQELVSGWLSIPVVAHDISLPSVPALLQDPNFKITSGSYSDVSGRHLIRVDFDYPHAIPSRPGPTDHWIGTQGGWILLDPDHSWCIAECQLRYKEVDGVNSTYRIDQQWREGRHGMPIITRMHRILQREPMTRPDTEQTIEFDLREPWILPSDDEFALSAFGLPDPPGMETPRPVRWYLWFMLAGVAAIIVATGFWRVSRRLKTAPDSH